MEAGPPAICSIAVKLPPTLPRELRDGRGLKRGAGSVGLIRKGLGTTSAVLAGAGRPMPFAQDITIGLGLGKRLQEQQSMLQRVDRATHFNLAIGVWKLGPANLAGFRDLIKVTSSQFSRRPRYMQHRQLRNGRRAYYWCAPSYARRGGFSLQGEPLGTDIEKAANHAVLLNAFLDDWKASRKSQRIQKPFGKISPNKM